jgi:TonB family protein
MAADSFQDKTDAASAPPASFRPDWLKKPTGEDLAWAYPEHASRLGLSGKAKIDCAVMADGKLARCKVLEESPAGENFGAAALALAPQFQMTRPPPGVAASSRVTIPLTFQTPPAEAPSRGSPFTPSPQPAPPLQPATAPLKVLALQTRDWWAHHVQPPPTPWVLGAGLALLLIMGGVALNRWSRQATGKDITGPNSERR